MVLLGSCLSLGSGSVRPGAHLVAKRPHADHVDAELLDPLLDLWGSEERIFLRLEDMIVITDTEAKIISDFVPRSIAGVEKLMAEEGLLQKYGTIR